MWSELRHFFWLQWKLTRAMFRGRRTGSRLRVLGLIFRLLTLTLTFPMFLMMGIGLAVVMIFASPGAAYEIAMVVNAFLFFIWLLLPASYNSQLIERFEMTQLFPHPIRFRTIIAGSTLMSFLTMTGLWTAPILLGEIVGLAWHRPLMLPLIVAGAVPAFTLLVLTGRIMEDFFDLVASDRRLRALVLALLSIPFMFCWLGQYTVQYVVEDVDNLPQFIRVPLQEEVEKLETMEEPETFGEFVAILSRLLEILRPSRLLIWLPTGWATAGMGLAIDGHWVRALPFLTLSIGFVALLLWTHARITRKLMAGAALTVGEERVRSRGKFYHLPGPPVFWAVFQKDWLYLWRSPIPRRLIFSTLVMVVAMALPMRTIDQNDISSTVSEVMPLLGGAFLITMISMAINLGLTANYFGTIDREGFVTLANTPLDRRFIILSANLAIFFYIGGQIPMVALGIALLSGIWTIFPLGLYVGLCLQIGSMPAYNLAAILAPYRAQLKHSGGRRRGNLWGMVAWAVSAPPILALMVLPYIFWKPGLVFTLPLGVIYSVGLYALTLKPLAQLLQRHEHTILQAIIVEE